MNELRAIYTIWKREGIRYIRDKARIFSTLLQPLMFLVIFGAGLSGTLNQGNFGIDFMKFMYPGIIAMSVMGVAFFSTVSTVWDREFGFLGAGFAHFNRGRQDFRRGYRGFNPGIIAFNFSAVYGYRAACFYCG